MTANGLTDASVYTDFQSLGGLRADARRQSPEALKAAAQQFEALFLQMMLKSMRDSADAMGGDDPFGGEQTALYRDMYDKQLSLEMAQDQGIGLADMLVRQLQGVVERAVPAAERGNASALVMPERQASAAVHPTDRASTAVAPTAQVRASPVTPSPVTASPSADPVSFDRAEDFVRELWPHARAAGEKLGVDPRALLAQAALETGWGRAVIRRPDGSSSYNLFNIKADQRWDGQRVFKDTLEYRGGVAAMERAPFRAYGSYAESFNDYVQFLQGQPRYREALEQAGDPTAFVKALHKAGYATDPAYADKIQGIMGRDLLARADALKNADGGTIS